MAHTPGPWEVINARRVLFVQAKTPEGHPYFGHTPNTEIMSDEDYPTKLDDAKLIAAAPELLAILQRALKLAKFEQHAHRPWHTEAEEVIKKATE